MKTVLLNGCTRCSGDLTLRRDYEIGLYAECLQCGHVAYTHTIQPAVSEAA